ncbi:MAG: GNAT family protein, partial [Armatimonadetes bacterium]|nr:GNAT family protein [Armatimonadota bacterium]
PTNLQTEESVQQWYQDALRAQEAGTEVVFVIVDKETGQAVGSTRFMDISAPNRGLEIGWTWLAPDVWRTRINTECKYLLLEHCFETLGAVRVQLKTDSRNLRSQKAMERLGAVREGVLRRHRILQDGYVRDSVYYSILPQEWEEVKKRLEGFLF